MLLIVYHIFKKGKVGTGYSFEDLSKLRQLFDTFGVKWIDNNSNNPSTSSSSQSLPLHLSNWKIGKKEDRPHVWIPVDKSIVLELKCAEIVESTQYSASVTCRFPRVHRIRYDKSVNDIMTMNDINEIRFKPRLTTYQLKSSTNDGNNIGGLGNEYVDGDNIDELLKNSSHKMSDKKLSKRKQLELLTQNVYGNSVSTEDLPPSKLLKIMNLQHKSSSNNRKEKSKIVDSNFRVSINKDDIHKKGNIFDNMIYCLIGNEFESIIYETNEFDNNDSIDSFNVVKKSKIIKNYTRQEVNKDNFVYKLLVKSI
jgi:hypothetical protein